MNIVFYDGETECNSADELNKFLEARYEGGVNEIELHMEGGYPYLAILIRNQWACVHFFQSETDCGCYAYCEENGLDEKGFMDFAIGSPFSTTEVSNSLVIPFSLAKEIAYVFFNDLKVSDKVKWFEL